MAKAVPRLKVQIPFDLLSSFYFVKYFYLVLLVIFCLVPLLFDDLCKRVILCLRWVYPLVNESLSYLVVMMNYNKLSPLKNEVGKL